MLAAVLVGAFFLGAFVASMVIESGWAVRRSATSGFLLFAEAALLLGFMAFVRRVPLRRPRASDAAAAILCFAMGIQNSLVTRLSGAVVRTTHLTGIVTDLGIESARWFRYWRIQLADRGHVRLTWSRTPSERPPGAKIALLATILVAFVAGAGGGAIAATHLGYGAMLLPAVALIVGAAYALLAPCGSTSPAPGGEQGNGPRDRA